MIDYSKIKVPFIGKTEIKKRAQLFRQKYWDDTIPVNIERIIEVDFGVDIIPVLNLVSLCNTDALITSDWSVMYVDKERYEDVRWYNYLTSSLAHEIGHIVLHRKLYESFQISDIDQIYEFLDKIPGEQYGFIETQADAFAGYVLVPLDKLQVEREKAICTLESHGLVESDIQDVSILHEYIADLVASPFDVSGSVVKTLLDNEFKD